MFIGPRTVILFCAGGALAACSPAPAADGVRSAEAVTMPYLIQTWVADDADGSPCGPNQGYQVVQANGMTAPIRMDTDGRKAGCLQAFGIADQDNMLSDTTITVDFHSDDPNGADQCGNPGSQIIPITPFGSLMTSPITIHTDDRPGGCREVFSIATKWSGVFLKSQFWPDDTGTGQCVDENGNSWTQNDIRFAKPGQNIEWRIDTDSRPGGCQQTLGLQVNYFGPIGFPPL